MAKKTAKQGASKSLKNSSELVPASQFILLLIAGVALVIGLLYINQPQDIRNQAKELGVNELVPLE